MIKDLVTLEVLPITNFVLQSRNHEGKKMLPSPNNHRFSSMHNFMLLRVNKNKR